MRKRLENAKRDYQEREHPRRRTCFSRNPRPLQGLDRLFRGWRNVGPVPGTIPQRKPRTCHSSYRRSAVQPCLTAKMKVLINECTPRALKYAFAAHGHKCLTVREASWSRKVNGEFLVLAEAEFYVLATLDTNLT